MFSINNSFCLSHSELRQTPTMLIKACNFTPFQIISYPIQVSKTLFTIGLDTQQACLLAWFLIKPSLDKRIITTAHLLLQTGFTFKDRQNRFYWLNSKCITWNWLFPTSFSSLYRIKADHCSFVFLIFNRKQCHRILEKGKNSFL